MTVNGIRVESYIRDLENDRYIYQNLIEEETKRITLYCLPLDQKDMNNVLNNIKKYNKKLLEIKEYSKNYEPKTLEEEIKLANKVGEIN